MTVLNHLIAPTRMRRKPRPAPPAAPLAALLLPQFAALDAGMDGLPADGPTGSAWSRAYILGAACASLQHRDAAPASDRDCFVAALDGFAMAYGATKARAILAATVAAAEAHEPEVEDGLMQGAADLALVAAGEAGAMLAFATRNGEELFEKT